MLPTTSFNTPTVAQTPAPPPPSPPKPIAKKRGRKPRVYTMTKVEGEFVIHFI